MAVTHRRRPGPGVSSSSCHGAGSGPGPQLELVSAHKNILKNLASCFLPPNPAPSETVAARLRRPCTGSSKSCAAGPPAESKSARTCESESQGPRNAVFLPAVTFHECRVSFYPPLDKIKIVKEYFYFINKKNSLMHVNTC
jgi:hypothetical protein